MIMILIASALAAGQAPAPAPSAEIPAKERMVCRHIEETGTRMGRRTVCKTASEWQHDQTEADEAITDVQKNDIIRPDPYAIPVTKPQ